MSAMEAINGLLINNEYMSIISNNIANASTIGYKSSKPVFFDIFSYSRESNNNYGYGVGISNIVQNFNNGTLIETGRDLDLGIIHDGFFRVIDTQGNIHYTRDGQFLLDKNKNIINMQGMYLTGKNQSYTKNRLNDISILKPINLDSAFILKEKPTSKIQLQAVFNSNTNAFNNTDNDNGNISEIEDYSTDFDIYKKNGQKEKINIYFNKEDTNIWKVHIESANPAEKNINKTFELKFNSNGELISDPNINIRSEDKNYENITLDLSGTIEQSDQENTIINKFQNGNEKASLKTFNIAPNGEIIGTYSNQKQQPIGQILLSRFINPEKLKPESGNLWSATAESGPENIGTAGDLGFGVLSQKTLETSNVDLNKELINMIIAQRNYQSNAQSFKTEDKIINTLINLR